MPLKLFRLLRPLCPPLRVTIVPRCTPAKRFFSSTNPVTAEALAEDVTIQQAFWEEPLGIDMSKGYGYFLGGPGSVLGPQDRYEIKNKLGYGQLSNVWLAHDRVDNRYVAIKILTAAATSLNKRKLIRESEVYERLSLTDSTNNHLPRLLNQFIHSDVVGGEDHLCVVMDLRHSNVEEATSGKRFFPVPALKKMLKHVLLGLAQLHKQGIAHTNLIESNVMINNQQQWTTEAVATWLKQNPPRTYPSTPYDPSNPNRILTAYVSQRLPPPSLDELVSCDFELIDFTLAQFVSSRTIVDITSLPCRPPEIILRGKWDVSVDIWTFGCLVYELATNGNLFELMAVPDVGFSEEDILLLQMMHICSERFESPLLQRCSRSAEFFQENCELIKFNNCDFKPFEESITDRGRTLSPTDMQGITDLMSKCLRLEPSNRATAIQLLEHPWLKI